ncbi:TPA: hypothetical protein ACFP4Q_000794 [Neisseria weaveri]
MDFLMIGKKFFQAIFKQLRADQKEMLSELDPENRDKPKATVGYMGAKPEPIIKKTQKFRRPKHQRKKRSRK